MFVYLGKKDDNVGFTIQSLKLSASIKVEHRKPLIGLCTLVYVHWFMYIGLCTLVYVHWFMDIGLCTLVYVHWFMYIGLCILVYGHWFMYIFN